MTRFKQEFAFVLLLGLFTSISWDAQAGKPATQPAEIAFIRHEVSNSGSTSKICGVPLSGTNPTTLAADAWGYPRWSPNGERVLYVEGRYLNQAVVSVAADGSDRQVHVTFAEIDAFNVAAGRPSVITANPFGWAGIFSADWSPDGSRIALDGLTRYEVPGRIELRRRIYVVHLSDGSISRVTDDGFDPWSYTDDIHPSWSQSLDVIGYSRVPYDGGGNNEVWAAAPNGAWSRALLTPADGIHVPYYHTWSHGGDGERLSSFVLASEGTAYVVDIDLFAANPVVNLEAIAGPSGVDYPSWAPDDSALVMSKGTSSTFAQILTYTFATGQEKIVLNEVKPKKLLFQYFLAPDWRFLP